MTGFRRLIAISVLASVAGCAGNPAPPAPPAAPSIGKMENGIAETLMARALDEMMAASPEAATVLGAITPRSRWDSEVSLRRKARILARYDDLISRGVDTGELDAANRAAIALFRHWAAVSDRAPALAARDVAISHVDGPQITLPLFLIQRHNLTTPASFRAYIERIRAMPDVVSQRITQAGKAPRLQPAAIASGIARTCELLTVDVRANPLFEDFVTRLRRAGIDDASRQSLQDDLVEALGAAMPDMCNQLHDYVASLDDNSNTTPPRPQYYEFKLFELTSLELSADAAHARLEAEADAARSRLDTPPGQIRPAGEDDATVQRLLNDAGNHVFDVEAALSTFTTLAPAHDLEIRRAESFRAHIAPPASYVPPTESNTAGIYYVNPVVLSEIELEAETERNTLPGRHLIPVTRLSRLIELPGFTAGWSLYAMSRMHQGDGTGRRFVMLLATAAAVADSGLHGQSWSTDRALDYLRRTTGIDNTRATHILDRILVQPGEAAAPVIGYIEFRRLREQAQTRLGESFDERDFHDLLLKDGMTTFEELTRRTQAWLRADAG